MARLSLSHSANSNARICSLVVITLALLQMESYAASYMSVLASVLTSVPLQRFPRVFYDPSCAVREIVQFVSIRFL